MLGRQGVTTLGIVLGMAALLAGCGGERAEQGAAPERRFVSVGTAPPGGAFFVVGGALAEVLDEHGGTGWRVTAEATKGTMENLRRLSTGEIDVALANSAITYFAVRGEEGWEKALPIRALMTLAPNVALFVTPEGSGVESIRDLAGRRVVLGPAGAGFEYFLRPILGAHGLGYDDLVALYATQAGAVDLLADGSAAAAFLGGAVPTASITQAATSQSVRFLPFEEAAVAELVGRYPFFDRATIPAATYPGQETEFSGLNVGSMHLVAAADTDEALVYEIVRVLWENRERVVEKHPAGRAINERVVVRDTGTEFHPGATRFYREIGIWPEAAASGAPSAAAD